MSVLLLDDRLPDLDAAVAWAIEHQPKWAKYEAALREVLPGRKLWKGYYDKGLVLMVVGEVMNNGKSGSHWQHRVEVTDRQKTIMTGVVKTVTCQECGKEAPKKNSKQKFCSPACAKRAGRQQKRTARATLKEAGENV